LTGWDDDATDTIAKPVKPQNNISWEILGSDGEPIFGDTSVPSQCVGPWGVMLLAHGFKGYKDYGFFPWLAGRAAEQGMIAHRFNFSHSGMTNRLDTFERPELFAADRWSRQIHDLEVVANAATTGRILGQGLPQIWFGHSRGGVTTLLTAAGERVPLTRPAGVVLAASPDAACNFTEDQKSLLRELGRLPSPSSRTGQDLWIERGWLDEIEAAPARFDMIAAAGRLTMPMLVVHGDADTTVPVGCAHRLAKAAASNCELRIIPGASHTFDTVNPMPPGEPPAATAQLAEAMFAFARRVLSKEPH